MPRTLHLIGFKKDGSTELVSGPEVDLRKTVTLIAQFRDTGNLKGFVRIEAFDSDEGRSRILLPHGGQPKPKPAAPTPKTTEPSPKVTGNKLQPL